MVACFVWLLTIIGSQSIQGVCLNKNSFYPWSSVVLPRFSPLRSLQFAQGLLRMHLHEISLSVGGALGAVAAAAHFQVRSQSLSVQRRLYTVQGDVCNSAEHFVHVCCPWKPLQAVPLILSAFIDTCQLCFDRSVALVAAQWGILSAA